MENTSRERGKIEGWKGRRRNYLCRKCWNFFQVDTVRPLPEGARICYACLQDPANKAESERAFDLREKREAKVK